MFFEKDGIIVHVNLRKPLEDLDEVEKREFDESLDDFLDSCPKFVEELFDSKED